MVPAGAGLRSTTHRPGPESYRPSQWIKWNVPGFLPLTTHSPPPPKKKRTQKSPVFPELWTWGQAVSEGAPCKKKILNLCSVV